MKRIPVIFLLAVMLSGCDMFVPALPPTTPFVYPPTFTPAPLTGTPIVLPPPPTLTPSPTAPTPTPTLTPTPTSTPTPTITLTPTPIQIFAIEVELISCNTSLDVAHGMGEVTNAYAVVRNVGNQPATGVCATLIANDEERIHPDKTVCVPQLDPGYQVTLKLTVDTAFQQETSVHVRVQTANAYTTESAQPACKDVGLPYVDPLIIRTPQPIRP